MNIFLNETVHQVRDSYPVLDRIVKCFPHFFMPKNALVSVNYRVSKAVAQLFIGIGSGLMAIRAFLVAPSFFIPAFGLGLGCGATAYLVQLAVRRKIHYEGTWSMLYIQGSAILKKKWRWIEAILVGGAVLGTYIFSSTLMSRMPGWASRQSGLGSGFWLGYLGSNVAATLFHKIHPKKATAHKVEANHFGARPRSREFCEESIAKALWTTNKICESAGLEPERITSTL